jgi:hypothetical protein
MLVLDDENGRRGAFAVVFLRCGAPFFVDACVLIFSKRKNGRRAKPAFRPALSGYHQLSPSLMNSPHVFAKSIVSAIQTFFGAHNGALVRSRPSPAAWEELTPSRLSVATNSCGPVKFFAQKNERSLGSFITASSYAEAPLRGGA